MDELAELLRKLDLERYQGAFRAADIDLGLLPLLTEDDLKGIGLSLGHRRKLMAAIADGIPANASLAPSPRPSEQERRQLTVLFGDIVGSTPLTERLDPEEMGRIIRQFQDAAAGAISRFDGFVDRFMGDSILAFFGFPRAHEDAAERAVRAGFAIIKAVGEITTPQGEPLSVRIAVASGAVFVGETVEHGGAREQIVTGEVVNLAARLQQVAPVNGIAITEETRRLLKDIFETTDLGTPDFKGVSRPINVWQVLRERVAGTRFEAAHRLALTPMVGREAEIGILKDRWEAASAGEAQVVLLSGEAGMGKSRIAQRLIEHIASEPHLVVRYQCSPFHINSALYPAIAQLQFAAGIEAPMPPEEKLERLEALVRQSDETDLVGTVPVLASLLSIPTEGRYPPLDLPSEQQKQRTMRLLHARLRGLARRQPVLFLLEDAHWIDPSTSELLSLWIEQVSEAAVLLLVTYRPEAPPRWTSRADITTLSINRLSKRYATAIVQHQAGGKRFPSELVDQILSKTDGVPLFVEELVKAILELGILKEEEGGYVLSGPLPTLAIPVTLHDSLLARLDRNPAAKEVAQVGAVIGREFSYAQLSALASIKGGALDAAIHQLLVAELVHQRGEHPQATYTFKHALIQDAAYSTLVMARRQQLHAHSARILLELSPEIEELHPELLAHHYSQARDPQRAAEYWLKAGRRAAKRSAYSEAVAHLNAGVSLVGAIPDLDRRNRLEKQLQVELGGPLIATLGFAAAPTMAAWQRAADLAEEDNDRPLLVRAVYGLWAARISLGETRAALAQADRVLRIADALHDEGVGIVGHRIRGLTLHTLGQAAAARAETELTVRLYDPALHEALTYRFGQNPLASALATLSVVLWLQGFPDQARQMGSAAVERATSLRHVNSVGYALSYGACLVERLRGDVPATERLADRLLTLSGEHNLLLWGAYGRLYKGWCLAQRRQYEEALRVLRDALAGSVRAGSALYTPMFQGTLAAALGKAGRTEEALAGFDTAIEEAKRREEAWWMPELLREKAALLLVDADSPDIVEALLREALAIAREHGLRAWQLRIASDLALVWRGTDKAADAAALLSPLVGDHPEPTAIPDMQRARRALADLGAVICPGDCR